MQTTPTFPDPIAWEDAILTGVRPSSPAWRATIKAIYGSPLTADESAIYTDLAGTSEPPPGGALEALVIAGRRGGKSETMARLATFEAIHGGHSVALARGQRAVIAVIASERKVAKEILGYCRGLCEHPAIKRQVTDVQEETVRFRGGIEIRILSADSTSVRGPTVVCAIVDEVCWLPTGDAANNDVSILEALRPALAPIRGAPARRLIAISSAGYRRGWAYDTVRANHGRVGAEPLTLIATTEQVNPNIDRAWLARRREASPDVYQREFLSQFADPEATAAWFGADVVRNAVGPVVTERRDDRRYTVAVDAAFRRDAFAIAVCSTRTIDDPVTLRRVRRSEIVHAVAFDPQRGKPLTPLDMVLKTRAICHSFGVATVFVDQHESTTLRQLFSTYGITAIRKPWTGGNSETSKVSRFSAMRDAMADGSLRIPQSDRLIAELLGISSTILPSGAERLEAAPGQKDDLACAAVLAYSCAAEQRMAYRGVVNERPEWFAF